MTIVDERNLPNSFAQLLLGQTCLINGKRYLKIANDGTNLLNLEDLTTGHAETTDAITDASNLVFVLKGL